MIEVEQFITRHMVCPTCQDPFKDPVTLLCGHTYCRNCLTGLVQSRPDAIAAKIIPCALRCQGTNVPKPHRAVQSWTSQMQPNYVITNLMDEFRQLSVNRCARCTNKSSKNSAVKWCPRCRHSLCVGCVKRHKRDPITKQHIINELPTTPRNTQHRYALCEDHGELIKLFCEDCNQVICNTCCSLHHRQCKSVVLIDTKLEDLQSTLFHYNRQLETEIDNKSMDIGRHRSRVKELGEIKRDCQSQIQQTFQTLMGIVKEKETSLLNELEKAIEEGKQHVQELIESAEVSRESYQQRQQFIVQAVESESVNEMSNIYQSHLSAEGSGFEANSNQSQHRAVTLVRFSVNIDYLKAAINQLDFGTVNVQYARNKVQHATDLDEDLKSKRSRNENFPLHDISVLDVEGVQTVVVYDSFQE